MIFEQKDFETLRELVEMKPLIKKLVDHYVNEQSKGENPWLNSTDFCKINRISLPTFWRWIKKKKIEAHPAMENHKIKLFRMVES